ncbi:helix-turn-helix transcriptional regulator [Parachryseolinea silvisoli]|uniref:helix-turn-helix transcriptional regulator n=1 Tax=Parachryseolinea silvisoli TaxID=2873601 RepID=UPI0022659C62|nr:AraC family transcriptional regulator [Parachryseolinea silvisoli]MCD9014450.1 AraC family transcriptional regulator [Parachryseolinea silvisoli]
MTSLNQITYDARPGVKFPFSLSNFRRHPQKTETIDFILSREFLGLVLNLGEPIEYSGSSLLPSTIEKSHYNLVYLPQTEYRVCIPRGLHHSIAMRLEPSTLTRAALDFAFLNSFLDNVSRQTASLIRDHHLPIPLRMQEEVDALLYNISKDEAMRHLFMEIKAYEIFFGAMIDMADLFLGQKPAYVVSDPTIRYAIEYLANTFKQKITIDAVASELGINKRKLQEGFKLHTGKNVHEYVVQLKMEEAKRLLRDPSRSVKSIAIELGYAETGFFNAYKNFYGQPPAAARGTELDKD